MAYNEFFADRIRQVFKDKRVHFEEKRMMGGLCFLVDDKMCVGIVKENLMLRFDPELQPVLLKKKGCKEMDFTGKPMKGYVFVEPAGVDSEKDLEYYMQLALDFNPKAKSSKKK